MLTFRDDQKLINIRMLTIYFMLTEQERAQYKDMIERLNRVKAFTLGLYEFKILTKLGEVNNCLTDNLKAEIESNNLIVRLPNDVSDSFVYAFDNIDLSHDCDAVEECLHNFVIELAEQSISLLKGRQEANVDGLEFSSKLDDAIRSYQEAVKSGKRSYARRTAPQVIRECRQEIFSYADDANFGVKGNTMLFNFMGGLSDTNDESLTRLYGCLRQHGIPESKQQKVASELADIFAEMFGVPGKEESAEIATGILDKKSNAIIINKCGRQKPSEKPNIQLAIERISYVDGRGKKRREKYGVRISVGTFEKQICFEDATQTMVYIAAILRHKMGKRLYIHELRNNGAGTTGAREIAKQWLKKIYTTTISSETAAFEKWIDSIRNANDVGKKLNTAASSTKRVVSKNLEMYPDAIYYSLLVSGKDAENGGYYTFNCSPDDVVICGELQEAMRGIPGIY